MIFNSVATDVRCASEGSSPARRRFSLVFLALGALAASGCTDSANTRATRSLRGSHDLSVLCATQDADGNLVGRPLTSCPDLDLDDGEDRKTYTLVTQQETGEVALVDLGFCADAALCGGQVLDLEVTQPGSNFLPVGSEPVSIVSTPGGLASFVAVAEPGKEGIYALPTSCIGPRPDESLFRDIRTWPACRLPAAPGSMEVVLDTQRQTSCDGAPPAPSSRSAECPADLSTELFEPSIKKLLVALPSLGQIAVLDAQSLLDLPQGSFAACPIERLVTLDPARPQGSLPQALPDDLSGTPAECLPRGFPHATAAAAPASRPSDFALSEGKLYVSDFEASVIHVLDVTDPCNIGELPPLLPESFLDPGLSVTTRKVAVSPLTPSGKRFVYAIDDTPGELAGSVMIFDVSRESGQRTPLIRPRSAAITNEPPDRIQFDQEASDIEFAVQDFPEADPLTGVAVEGLACEPLPSQSSSPGALYRPNRDSNEGASPSKLRGAFAFVALQSGFVVTVDVEDLDAACRRPQAVNPSAAMDLRGCVDDPFSESLAEDGIATVSNEFSCNISQPHRARPSAFFDANQGGSAPALRAFPQLRDRNGTSLAVDQSDPGRTHPRLLAVNHQKAEGNVGDAALFVGTTRYENQPEAADRLILDPAESERNSLVLPYIEPRAYRREMVFAATYEGAVRPLGDGLLRLVDAGELGLPAEELGNLPRSRYAVVSRGPDAAFCEAGVEDAFLIRDRAARLIADSTPALLDQFAEQYADYLDISAELLPKDDAYWRTGTGRSCGESLPGRDGATGHLLCDLVFGTPELPNVTREFRVQRAFNNQLLVEPRRYDNETERDNILDLAECCFPQNIDFRVRASQQWVVRASGRFAHDIGTDPDSLACIRDCSPLVQGNNGRVFEISCVGDESCRVAEDTPRVIGPPVFEGDERGLGTSLACIIGQHPVGGVQPGDPGSECFYASQTARFAIYRGLSPSERDMQFAWRVLGGFVPLSVDLLQVAQLQTTSNPQRLKYVGGLNRLLVADGGSTGLVFVGLRRSDGGPGFSGTVAF